MRYLNDLDLIFYLGASFIILYYAGVLTTRFKDEEINLKEHFWIIILYITLLIATIWVWRYIFDIFFSEKLLQILQPTKMDEIWQK